MVPNWSVLNDDGWGRAERGAGRWLESPDVAIADTRAGQEQTGDPFLVNRRRVRG
jgi:hypothetical protein